MTTAEIRKLADEATEAFRRFIEAFASALSEASGPVREGAVVINHGTTAPNGPKWKAYDRVSSKTPWSIKSLRQSLIIDDILTEGGSVPKTRWYEIAAKYGYEGRGLAGFFRSGQNGLLTMKNGQVHVTKSGKVRHKANLERIAEERVA